MVEPQTPFPMHGAKSNIRVSRQVFFFISLAGCLVHRLWLRHVAHTARCAADCHACLQVVDEVCDGCDEDEEDEDDEEDDNVALHGGGWWRGLVVVVVWLVKVRSSV
jgi:hypothetical protein